jgi:hypothetical protein
LMLKDPSNGVAEISSKTKKTRNSQNTAIGIQTGLTRFVGTNLNLARSCCRWLFFVT